MTPLALAGLAIASFSAGFVDAIAGGGGLLSVPALLATGLPPHVALGTNKGQACFGVMSSSWSFHRRGLIDRTRAPVTFVCALLGSLGGAALLLAIRPEPLRPVVLVLLVVAAILVTFAPRAKGIGVAASARIWAAAAMTLVLGVYDGFFGPGVGTMLIAGFCMIYGEGATSASGNAKVANLASNLAAVALFAWRGRILWEIALPMAASNALGSALGARVAVAKGDRLVRAVALTVVAALLVKVGYDTLRS